MSSSSFNESVTSLCSGLPRVMQRAATRQARDTAEGKLQKQAESKPKKAAKKRASDASRPASL